MGSPTDASRPSCRSSARRKGILRDEGEGENAPRPAKCRKTRNVSVPERQKSEDDSNEKRAKESKRKGSALQQKSMQTPFTCARNIFRGLPWVIGLVSDTHGRFDENLRKVFLGVNEIWHGGDIAGRGGSQSSAEDVLTKLSSIAPVTKIVRGNVDTFAGGLKGHSGHRAAVAPEISDEYPQVSFVSLPAGKEAVMTHIGEFPTAHLERRGSLNNTPGADLGDCSESRALVKKMLSVIDEEGAHKSKSFPAPNIVVFGHSHKPGIVVHQDVMFINPGSAGPKRFSLPTSAAILRIDEDGAVSAEIVAW